MRADMNNRDHKENKETIDKFIQKMLEKYNHPCMGITIRDPEWIQMTSVWTRKMIEECIKKGY
jgi:hypothetical protein